MSIKIELADADVDAPLRLSIAASLAFPDGTMKASGLRREAARGRLVIERIAGKYYTTLKHIERMRELCRVRPDDQDSGCAQNIATAMARFDQQLGSSSTEASTSPQDALKAKLQKQKDASRRSSPRSTSQNGNVTMSKTSTSPT
jgi:hypothetical protein